MNDPQLKEVLRACSCAIHFGRKGRNEYMVTPHSTLKGLPLAVVAYTYTVAPVNGQVRPLLLPARIVAGLN